VEQAYAEPSVTTYSRGGDALDDGLFVFNLLPTVTPEDLDATSAAPAATESAVAGVYVSPVYPAADAPGLITVLALYANGNAEQTSINLTNRWARRKKVTPASLPSPSPARRRRPTPRQR